MNTGNENLLSLATPPQDEDEFDAYVANDGFQKIKNVAVMEQFLLRAARRFHVLNAEMAAAINSDQKLPLVKQEAWETLYFNFVTPYSDLRMFFSETEDFYEQTPEERNRLNAVAEALVCSGKDASKIDYAETLSAEEQLHEEDSHAFGM